jgi:hypothetical protein
MSDTVTSPPASPERRYGRATSGQVLRMRIGVSLTDVKETFSLSLDAPSEFDLVAIDQPLRIEYISKGAAIADLRPGAAIADIKFELPDAAMAAMRLYAGHLVSLRAMPQLHRLSAHEGVSRAECIARRVETAGWHPRSHPEIVIPSEALQYLSKKLGRSKTGIESLELCLGSWERRDGVVKDERISLFARFVEAKSLFFSFFSRSESINAECKLTFIADSPSAEEHFDREVARLRREDKYDDPAPRKIDKAYVDRVHPLADR